MFKLTKQDKDFWLMEKVDESEINENEQNDDIIYLDIPSIEESTKIWEEKLNKILKHLK
jgi:sortase (surface protein transpeptidase)